MGPSNDAEAWGPLLGQALTSQTDPLRTLREAPWPQIMVSSFRRASKCCFTFSQLRRRRGFTFKSLSSSRGFSSWPSMSAKMGEKACVFSCWRRWSSPHSGR